MHRNARKILISVSHRDQNGIDMIWQSSIGIDFHKDKLRNFSASWYALATGRFPKTTQLIAKSMVVDLVTKSFENSSMMK